MCLLRSSLSDIRFAKPYNRDVESQPNMAQENKIELHISGPKANWRAEIVQYLVDLCDMWHGLVRKYTLACQKGHDGTVIWVDLCHLQLRL